MTSSDITAPIHFTLLEVDVDIDGVKDDYYGEGPATEETIPGGFIPLNGLVKINLMSLAPSDLPINAGHPVTLKAISGGEKIRIWDNENKTGTPITLPKPYTSRWTDPIHLWVEGIELSSTPRDITLALEYAGFEDRIRMTVYCITVTWETYMDNILIDPHPAVPPNGGKRIFPDKKSYDDTNAADRKKARVKATITPAVDNKKIYFKGWDVDDPETSPIIDWLDPYGPATGPDNYGTGAFLSSTEAVTDGSGEARVTLTVSMNPGDNFKIAASLDKSNFDPYNPGEMTQEMADGLEPLPASVFMSEMLTVWRKLHLELDSMTTGQDNPVSNRNIDETWNDTPHTGESGAEINGWNIHPDEGQYEGGMLTVSGVPPFEIIDNIDDWGDDTVYVLGNICPYENTNASFTDDDICPLPRKVDWSLMNSKFNPAYVEVVEEPGVYNSNATFIANLTGLSVTEAVRNRTTASDYWMAQVMSCHQGERSTDGDADSVYHWHGSINYKTGDVGVKVGESSPTGDNICVIYLESIRDQAAQEPFLVSIGWRSTAYSDSDIERTVVVHEIGHVFGCVHSDGEIMQSGAEDPALDFNDVSINRIRTNNP